MRAHNCNLSISEAVAGLPSTSQPEVQSKKITSQQNREKKRRKKKNIHLSQEPCKVCIFSLCIYDPLRKSLQSSAGSPVRENAQTTKDGINI